MKKIKIILLLLLISCPLHQSVYSQTQMLWSKPSHEDDNFNQNQYECPLWVDAINFYDFTKGVALSPIVRDFNNDGYCDVFFNFASWNNEFIPFKLFLYNPISGELEDNSSLILNNVGQTASRKLLSADFNGDGILDVVTVSHPEVEGADLSYLDVVLSNDVGGWEQFTLSTPSRNKNEGYYHGVAVGDVDNDGDIDFVVANIHTDVGMITYLNDGEGNFSTMQLYVVKQI